MKKLLFCLIFIVPVSAFAEVPTDISLKEFLIITDSKNLIEQSMAQTDLYVKQGMQEALEGKEITPELQQIIDESSQKMSIILKDEMSWAKMEPDLMQICRESFSQAEIDGLIQFYKSDLGQAVIKKMPIVMSKNLELISQRSVAMAPKMQPLIEDTIRRVMVVTSKNKKMKN